MNDEIIEKINTILEKIEFSESPFDGSLDIISNTIHADERGYFKFHPLCFEIIRELCHLLITKEIITELLEDDIYDEILEILKDFRISKHNNEMINYDQIKINLTKNPYIIYDILPEEFPKELEDFEICGIKFSKNGNAEYIRRNEKYKKNNWTFLEYEIDARTPRQAKNIYSSILDKVLSLLRCTSGNYYNNNEITQKTLMIKGIRNTAKAFSVNSEDFSFTEDIIYTPINIHILNDEILEKIKTTTENNPSVLIAAKWLLKAINSKEKEDQIVYCSIAMESLLLNGERNKAIILSERSKSFLKREIYDEINLMYNLRNNIVHDGLLDIEKERIITKEYISRIFTYIRSIIFRIVNYNVSKNQLIKNIDLSLNNIYFIHINFNKYERYKKIYTK